jgi:hypothetical protein
MNWEAIGSLGEVVGAIAVLVTLVYLTLQVRQGNRLMQAQYREMNRSAVLEVFDPIIRDGEFAELIENSRKDTASLEVADQRRVFEQQRNELLLAQSIYVRAGLIGEDRTAKIGANLAARMVSSHVIAREFWDSTEWDPDFAGAVHKLLAENHGATNDS